MTDLSKLNSGAPVDPVDERIHDDNFVLNELKRLAIYTQGTLITHLVDQGYGFSVSNRYTSVGNGESIYLYVENPTNSGFDYDVVLNPRASGLSLLDISFNATQNDGTAITANNLKSGSTRTFSGVVEGSTTGDAGTRPTHGTIFIEDMIPGGSFGTRVGGAIIGGVSFTVDEGDNKLIELTNEGNATALAINLYIFEDDGTVKFSTNA